MASPLYYCRRYLLFSQKLPPLRRQRRLLIFSIRHAIIFSHSFQRAAAPRQFSLHALRHLRLADIDYAASHYDITPALPDTIFDISPPCRYASDYADFIALYYADAAMLYIARLIRDALMLIAERAAS